MKKKYETPLTPKKTSSLRVIEGKAQPKIRNMGCKKCELLELRGAVL